MHIALESPLQAEVIQLVHDLDAYQMQLYPPESHHGIDVHTLSQPHVLFAVARHADGTAMACGAIVLGDEFSEVKRMYVRPEHRGQGIASQLLSFLEAQARARGHRLFVLETGISQPEAIALYERSGYGRCAPFGGYAPDPFSVFMQKLID